MQYTIGGLYVVYNRGSICSIGEDKDIERRRALSTTALSKLNEIWIRKDKIRKDTKLKLYKSLIKSILLYNCGTWGLTKHQEVQ